MINNIIFDIDDTLFPSSEFSSLARRNAVRAMIRMGLVETEEEITGILDEILKKKGSNYPYHFDDLLKRLKIDNKSRFVAAAVGAYHDTKAAIQPFPDVPGTLLTLKDVGYNLYVASNGISVKQWDKLIRLGIGLYMDGVFVSEDLKCEKSEKFYRKMIKRMKAEPKECIMVGDREDMDILPAKKAGLHTIRVLRGKYRNSPKKSRADATITDFRKLPSTVLKLSR